MSDNTAKDAYKEIQDRIGPNVLQFFGHKAMDYDTGPAFQFLGSKGQFGDINRKFWKLYKAMWLDEELVGEQPVEILYDLIGHCLLTIWLLEQEKEGSAPDTQPGGGYRRLEEEPEDYDDRGKAKPADSNPTRREQMDMEALSINIHDYGNHDC